MPKYILIGLGVMLILFVSMHFWGKLTNQGKNLINISLVSFSTYKSALIF